MGNSFSQKDNFEISSTMRSLASGDYPVLDIGNKNGHTGYLDFISTEEISAPVTKGKDQHGRLFFVVRAKVGLSNGKTLNVFETFFQRYSDNDVLWHGCGHGGIQFMWTEGGLSLCQAKFLKSLLENTNVELTEEVIENIRFDVPCGNKYISNDDDTVKYNSIVKSKNKTDEIVPLFIKLI